MICRNLRGVVPDKLIVRKKMFQNYGIISGNYVIFSSGRQVILFSSKRNDIPSEAQ